MTPTRILKPGTKLKRRDVLKLSLAGGAAATLGLSAPAIGQQPKILRYGHNLPADSIYHRAISMFGTELNKLSNNRFRLDIFPSSQLGGMAEMLQSVQSGSLTFSMAVPAWYSAHMKSIDVFTLPYLVSSTSKLKSALDGRIGSEIVKLSDETGFRIIGHWLIGGRHFLNRVRPVHKPDDCKGLKVRVINSQVYLQTFRALGANPVGMDPSEIYLAMQQGVIDGFDFPVMDTFLYKFYEVAKYMLLDQHTVDFFMVATGKNTWAGFNAEEQAIVAKAMQAAMDWQWKAQPEEIETTLVKLKSLTQVSDLTPENRELFVKATRGIYAQIQPTIKKDFFDLVMKEFDATAS